MAKIGRNDPCPCVSGKKYMHCCCAKEQEADSMAQGARTPFPGALMPCRMRLPVCSATRCNEMPFLVVSIKQPANNLKSSKVTEKRSLVLNGSRAPGFMVGG